MQHSGNSLFYTRQLDKYAKPQKLVSFRSKEKGVIHISSLERTKRLPESEAFESMGQNWIRTAIEGHECFYDQFNFMILRRFIDCFELYHEDDFVVSTYTLDAAKTISLVLLNDKLKSKSHVSP